MANPALSITLVTCKAEPFHARGQRLSWVVRRSTASGTPVSSIA
ncbi:hypothetical protein [Kitasatospora sp. NPDC051914]